MDKDTLEEDYKYFLDNKSRLVKDHDGKFVVIKNKQVIGSYDNQVEAYTETTKNHKPGTFVIQYCSPHGDNTQIFQTRVIAYR